MVDSYKIGIKIFIPIFLMEIIFECNLIYNSYFQHHIIFFITLFILYEFKDKELLPYIITYIYANFDSYRDILNIATTWRTRIYYRIWEHSNFDLDYLFCNKELIKYYILQERVR